MIRCGSSRLACVVPVCSWWWFSEPSLDGFLGVFSGPWSWGFGGGCMCEPFVVLFPLIPLPNPWVKGLDFEVFGALGLEEFLAGFLRFLLIWQVLVDINLAMDSSWGVPTIPKVLHKSVERFGRSGFGFGGVDPRVLFFPRSPGHTGLTGASHQSDRCRPSLGFARENIWVSYLSSRVVAVSSLGQFGARWAWLVFWGFLAGTGLTGVLHQPDRCRVVLWKSPGFTSRDRSDRWCSPAWPV
jgi:hypothetical protein